jgi:hypothetical protein
LLLLLLLLVLVLIRTCSSSLHSSWPPNCFATPQYILRLLVLRSTGLNLAWPAVGTPAAAATAAAAAAAPVSGSLQCVSTSSTFEFSLQLLLLPALLLTDWRLLINNTRPRASEALDRIRH